MKRTLAHAIRGVERATRQEGAARLVRTTVNGRSEMLPDDLHEVVKVFAARRSTPAAAIRARILADLRKRGHG